LIIETVMAFEPGNQEWKNRKACKGGRPSKQELEKRVLEKEEWDRTVRAYATLEATYFFQPEAQAQTTQETRFGDALSKLDVEAVRQALKSGANPNERYNRTGLSAISRVTSSLIMLNTESGRMTLDEAEEKAIAIFDVLFEAGAQLRPYDNQVLYWPVSQGARKVTKYLLDRGANPNAGDNSGSTPVTLGTYYGHPDIVGLLVEYGAKPLDSVTSTQIRFIAAAGRGDVIALKRELSNGARVNSQRAQITKLPLLKLCLGVISELLRIFSHWARVLI
jgi:ankyrin repeat protein